MPYTFRDFRLSRAPDALGRCATDVPYLLNKCNEARQRLIETNKNQGFFGVTASMLFPVVNGFITTYPYISRITDLAVCQQAVAINNPFGEFLSWGNGLQPPNACQGSGGCGGATSIQAYDRGYVPSARDIDPVNQTIRIYPTDARDVGRRILVQGLDQNGVIFRCQDGFSWVLGQYISIAYPFTNIGFAVSKITGVQKDQTYGDLLMFQVDMTTGVEVLLSRYQPGETAPAYRRYWVNNMPANCCSSVPGTPVQGIAKMDYYPVQLDSDWLLIDSIPALIAECQSIRYGDMETPEARTQAAEKHREAIRLLNNNLDHHTDRNNPAISQCAVERESLRRAGVGTLI